MANILHNLDVLLNGSSIRPEFQRMDTVPQMSPDTVIYSTDDKDKYDKKMDELRQQKLLSYQWVKAKNDVASDNVAGYTAVKLMYRDADLMCSSPEIDAALEVIAQEACASDSKGQMLHVYSPSKRIKSILEDLFINRLNINVILPQIAKGMCKYGNYYELLNVDLNNGILGWMKLNPYEIDRVENNNRFFGTAANNINVNTGELQEDSVKFIWTGRNESTPFHNLQVAHFRELSDSFFLPYGTSVLHKVRRAWRMWSMMEDAMLIYRLDKSVERRVFKIYVGGIDTQDIPAYVQQIANNFKRTPIVDPATGQIDLRKNFLPVDTDYFIPVRTENAANPIETLSSAQNPTIMDDINYMLNKILAGLLVPKSFLNYQEAQGKAQNLSLVDIRFCRKINKIQQFLLLELNKIAMIHLYLLGFRDDVTNFTLSLTNPSAQIEALELEDLKARISTAQEALRDPGTGMPLLSLHKVLRDIMKLSDNEIMDMLNEIMLEKAMVGEIGAAPNVIHNTGVFDKTLRIYGDYKALHGGGNNNQGQGGEGGGPEAGGGGGGGGLGEGGGLLGSGGGDFGMGDFGGGEETGGGEMAGAESEIPMGSAPEVDNGGPAPSNESIFNNKKPLILEQTPLKKKAMTKSFTEQYLDKLRETIKEDKPVEEIVDYIGKNTQLHEEMEKILSHMKEGKESEDNKASLLQDIKTVQALTGGTKDNSTKEDAAVEVEIGVEPKPKTKRGSKKAKK